MDNFNAGSRTSGQGTNDYSFSEKKMADIGGRSLPTVTIGDNMNNETFGAAKLAAIGGRDLPAPDQGASTLHDLSVTNVDNFGKFPN